MKAMTRIAALRERLSRANQQLQELADKDGLTGLCNRRSMDKKLDQAFEAARRVGQSFGLLMMDIDNFKKYNDHYGHLQGDECLRNVAQAIQKGVQAVAARSPSTNAFAARYGGEEFAAVLPGADAATVAAAADAVLNEIRQLQLPHAKNDHWGKVTISVGGALLQTATGPIKTLFHTADDLLYRAKAAGRNRAELA
jgi:diguanylate cyclase (GGDEF)-like protein